MFMQEKAVLEKKVKAQGDTIEELSQALEAQKDRVGEETSVLSDLRGLLRQTTSK